MEKLSALAGEPTHNGRSIERSVIQVDKINAPLPRGGIVEAKRLRLDVKLLVGASDFELFEVRVAIEKLVVIRDAVVLVPNIRVIQAVGQAANMSLPVADKEVEVMGAIALREIGRIVGGLGMKWNCEPDTEGKKEKQEKYHDFAEFHQG
jgi:hypothetical protein